MSDIVERLRVLAQYVPDQRSAFNEAAAEIEQLRAQVDHWKRAYEDARDLAKLAITSTDLQPVKPEPHRWPRQGDKMRFLGRNGYPVELEEAKKIFTVGNEYTVHDCDVHSWSHSIQFVGVKGRFNGVMFELSPHELNREAE